MADNNPLQNVFKLGELRSKLIFTCFLLFVYRIGIHIPTPGIDSVALKQIFDANKGGILGMFNMFSGGGLERLSVFALGIMPYISASIILQLLTVAVPHLERLSKEGDYGRKKITQYTRYGTVLISLVQGFAIAVGLEAMNAVLIPGWHFRLMTVITLTAGTSFIMWLGEQITNKGIGNGISLIIFAGIVARMPGAIFNTYRLISAGEMSVFFLILLVVFMVLVIAFIIFFETAQRRIPIQYAKRVVGRKMYGGQSSFLPLKINTSGVIPPIFASSIIIFPATVAGFVDIPALKSFVATLTPGNVLYEVLFVGFIIFFCFFYTAVTFNPKEVSENIKRNGGYIPGIRPGQKTAEYIDKVLTRITLGGALYISLVCVLPSVLTTKLNVPFYFGGTALLIVVGVAIDTIAQIESQMISKNYAGFLKKGIGKRG